MSNVGKKFKCLVRFAVGETMIFGLVGEVYECVMDQRGDSLVRLEGKWIIFGAETTGGRNILRKRLTNGQFKEVVEPQELTIDDLVIGEKYKCIKSFNIPSTSGYVSAIGEIYEYAYHTSCGPRFLGKWEDKNRNKYTNDFFINENDVKYFVKLGDEPAIQESISTIDRSILCNLQKGMLEVASDMADCIALAD